MALLTRSLTQLRAGAREAAKMEGSDFVSDSELDRLINESIESLYDETIQRGEVRSLVGKTATLSGAGPSLSLPSDFYQLHGLYFTEPRATPILRLQEDEFPVATELSGNLSFRLRYIPTVTRLSDPADTFTYLPKWDTYVHNDVAAMLLVEEESDAGAQMQRRDRALAAMLSSVDSLDRMQPRKVRDVRFADRRFREVAAYRYELSTLSGSAAITLYEISLGRLV